MNLNLIKPLHYGIVLLLIVLVLSALSQLYIFNQLKVDFAILIMPAVVCAGCISTALLLFIGLKFNNIIISFRLVFKAVLAGTTIFIFQYILEFLWLLSKRESYKGFELANFSSLSLFQLYHPDDLPSYLIYPFQVLNLWEVVNIIIIIYALKKMILPLIYKNIGLVISITYLTGVFMYVLFVTFINLSRSI